MRYAFVAERQNQFGVRAMSRCLAIQPTEIYAWRKASLSRRTREDARQIALIGQAWSDSGKVYGYRKLHDDLLDQGETCCPNHVARLTNLAGIGRRSAESGAQAVQEEGLRPLLPTRWIASSTCRRLVAPG